MEVEHWMVESFLQALHNIATAVGFGASALWLLAIFSAFRK